MELIHVGKMINLVTRSPDWTKKRIKKKVVYIDFIQQIVSLCTKWLIYLRADDNKAQRVKIHYMKVYREWIWIAKSTSCLQNFQSAEGHKSNVWIPDGKASATSDYKEGWPGRGLCGLLIFLKGSSLKSNLLSGEKWFPTHSLYLTTILFHLAASTFGWHHFRSLPS